MGWWRELQTDRSRDHEKASRLVNCLAKFPGSRQDKLKWILANLPLLEAHALQEFDPQTQRREFGAKMLQLTIRFYRASRRKARQEQPQQAGERSGEMERIHLADVLPIFREGA